MLLDFNDCTRTGISKLISRCAPKIVCCPTLLSWPHILNIISVLAGNANRYWLLIILSKVHLYQKLTFAKPLKHCIPKKTISSHLPELKLPLCHNELFSNVARWRWNVVHSFLFYVDDCFPDSTRRGDVEAGRQQTDSSSTSFYTF